MSGWRNAQCPNAQCGKRFYSIQDAVEPRTASTQDFFKFINYSQTGRVSKDELIDWYMTNFNTTREDVAQTIDENWHLWDVPKNRSFFSLGWFRSKDQGDLDTEEFPAVQEFMSDSLARSLASTTTAAPTAGQSAPVSEATVAPVSTSEPRGEKRARSEADSLVEGFQRNVAQKKLEQAMELQRKLKENNGLEWFNHFDFDKSVELERKELTTALLQTLMGTHKVTREQITSIVDSVWDAIDADGSGSVHFQEFQMLREALIAQLDLDKVTKAISGISRVA